MSDVVFILGAGASHQAGAPLMYNFLDRARDLHATNVGENQEHFDRVFRAIAELQTVHSKSTLDLNNIESIFTTFELASVLGKLPGHSADDITAVVQSIKELIVTTLQCSVKFPVEKGSVLPPEPYRSLARLIADLQNKRRPKLSSSIITFNYDIAADVALHSQGLGPFYAIPSALSQGNGHVALLKLHGSLNWAFEPENEQILVCQPRDYLRFIRITTSGPTVPLHVGSHLQQFFEHKKKVPVNREPVIVPPTWNKAGHQSTLASVWSRAAAELEEAKHIFIIGYSLPQTDSFFRQLYALGTAGGHPLRNIIVFNPEDSGDVEQRFRSMIGPGAEDRFKYRAKTFEQSMSEMREVLDSEGALRLTYSW